jgi:hypothetical protein
MNEIGFLTHLIRTVQSIYQSTTIIIRKAGVTNNIPIEINKGV